MKKTLKIDIIENYHYVGYDFCNNLFYRLLSKKYNIVQSRQPDFLFHSVYPAADQRFQFTDYSCTRILYSSECVAPNFKLDDYALTFDHIDSERHFRLPFFRYLNIYKYIFREKLDPEKALKNKKRFCNFVHVNAFTPQTFLRADFFKKLSKYKQVDSLGPFLNNVGYNAPSFYVIDNIDRYLTPYKFSISFENTSHKGYTTEKLMNALLGATIPIYWGNPDVGFDFNTKCFINCHDFNSFDEVIEHVKEVDSNDKLWMDYYAQPVFKNNREPDHFKDEAIEGFLEKIIEKPFPLGKPVAEYYQLKSFQQKKYCFFYLNNRSRLNYIKGNCRYLEYYSFLFSSVLQFFIVYFLPQQVAKKCLPLQKFILRVILRIFRKS